MPRLLAVMFVLATAVGSLGLAEPASAQSSWNLVSLRTPYENFQANQRTFRVDNPTDETTRVTLENRSIGQTISVDAPPGQSRWQVPAGSGSNTTILTVPNGPTITKSSNNRVCAVVSGVAVCDPTVGQTTVTWTVNNNDGSAKPVAASAQSVTYSPNPVPANGTASGTQVIVGPASEQTVTEIVTVDLGADVISRPTASLYVAACVGPDPPPDVSFTFTKEASTATANVGDTVDYVYCGQNQSSIPLEVTRLTDDRLGVVIELPDTRTLVEPGETLCTTDLDEPRSYVVTDLDAGTTIENAAVVTVRDPATDRVFQATAVASVEVPLPPLPVDPDPSTTTTTPRTTTTTAPGATSTKIAGATSTAPGPTTTVRRTLPATGPWRTDGSALVAVGLIALGATAVAISRRR